MLADRVRMGSGKDIFPPYIYKTGKIFSQGLTLYKGRLDTPDNFITLESNRINLNSSNSGIIIGISTANMIDLTNYSKIYIEWEQTLITGYISALFITKDKTNFYYEVPAGDQFQNNNTLFERKIGYLDISNKTGEYYIQCEIEPMRTDETNLFIYNLWLE